MAINSIATLSEFQYFTKNGSDVYYSDGNVGIGTSSPTAPLEVIGNINFTGTLTQNGSTYSGGGTGVYASQSSIRDLAVQAAVFMIGV